MSFKQLDDISDSHLSGLYQQIMPSGRIWGAGCHGKGGWEIWAADPGKTCVWRCLSEDVHAVNTWAVPPPPASSHCQQWAISWYQRAWVRVQKPPLRTASVGNLFTLTDLFILSALVLSRSWEKFLPKCTLTCASVLGTRKWCCFLKWLEF